MCVAGLNVSTQPCSHRWYSLKRSCEPNLNLANCPEKIRLEGWEQKNDTCPWCCNDSPERIHESTHRLFGSGSSSNSTTSSPTSPILGATRTYRSGSGSTLSSLSRHSSTASTTESERGLRSREMNDRLNLYLTASPHEVLPSARKNYPSYIPVVASQQEESPASDRSSIRSAGTRFGNRWKKSVRFPKGMSSD